MGLIGAGRWGPNVIGAINRLKGCELLKVADNNQAVLSGLN